MTKERDIYNPPPPPLAFEPPMAEPLDWSRADLSVLIAFGLAVGVAAVLAWRTQPLLAIMTVVGGALVVLESWYTALGFLQRQTREQPDVSRMAIYLAALLPWMISLGLATAIMMAVFLLSDWSS